MGKSNSRRDSTKFDDYADDYEDYAAYRDMGSGMDRYMEPDAEMSSDPAQASTATKAKTSTQQAKQKAKRSNQSDR
jgi:hypothetical protein